MSNHNKNKRNVLFAILTFFIAFTGLWLFNHNGFNETSTNMRSVFDSHSSLETSFAGTGCILDKKRLGREAITGTKNLNFGQMRTFSTNMLSKYSLEDYLPEIGDQGDVGSCVGWSTTYYGFTIIKRIEHGKDYPAFSPLSIFNRFSFMNGTNPCSNGAYIDECLALLVSRGCPYERDYDKPNCSLDQSKTKYKDRLSGYEKLQSSNALQIKSALMNNNPVIIGMNVFAGGKGNALNSKFLDSNGVVRMENFRNNSYRAGGHALCIVGFDDNISGGAFKIVNSWGKDWGKKGFFWLRYNDLDIVRCAYALLSNENIEKRKGVFKTNQLRIQNNSGNNYYIAFGFQEKDVRKAKGWYFIKDGQEKTIDISNRINNTIYYLLMDDKGNVIANKDNTTFFPSKSSTFFDLAVNENGEDIKSYSFFKFNPLNKKNVEYVYLSGSSKPRISK